MLNMIQKEYLFFFLSSRGEFKIHTEANKRTMKCKFYPLNVLNFNP